jgi:hypothetical protein
MTMAKAPTPRDADAMSPWAEWLTLLRSSRPAVPGRYSGILPRECRWSGTVWMDGDVVVPRGGRLVIEPGTRVRVSARPRWKQSFSRLGDQGQRYGHLRGYAALAVWGELVAEGRKDRPVRFLPDGDGWAGLLLFGSARARLRRTTFTAARFAGLAAFDRSAAALQEAEFAGCRAAVLAGGESVVSLSESRLEGGEAGTVSFDDAAVSLDRCRLSGFREGVRAGDDSLLRLYGCGVRDCSFAGVSLRDRARASAWECVFEGNPHAALALTGASALKSRHNRLFQNGFGVLLSDRAELRSEDDTVGPDERSGVLAWGRASLSVRRAFFHGHGREAALRTRGAARAELADCRFYGDAVGGALADRSSWRVERGEFQGATVAALQADGGARLRIEGASFRRNARGVVLYGRSRAEAVRCRFEAHSSAAWSGHVRSRSASADCLWEGNVAAVELEDGARHSAAGDEARRQSGHGMLARGSARLSADRCGFDDNGGAGVQGLEDARVDVTRSRFSGNEVGVGVGGRARGAVRGNTFAGQRREGVSLASAVPSLVRDNAFTGNAVGVGHFESDRSRVRANRFFGNRESAGLAAGAAAPRWVRNVAAGQPRGLDRRDRSAPTERSNRWGEASSPSRSTASASRDL